MYIRIFKTLKSKKKLLARIDLGNISTCHHNLQNQKQLLSKNEIAVKTRKTLTTNRVHTKNSLELSKRVKCSSSQNKCEYHQPLQGYSW